MLWQESKLCTSYARMYKSDYGGHVGSEGCVYAEGCVCGQRCASC